MAASPAVTAVKPITKKNGRPSIRTEANAVAICDRIACGETLRRICLHPGLPSLKTVVLWLREDDNFRTQYLRAREEQADYFADEIIEISDSAKDSDSAAAAKVKIYARIWHASKTNKSKYGEKGNETHVTTVTNNNLILLDESRLIELQERRQKQLAELTQ